MRLNPAARAKLRPITQAQATSSQQPPNLVFAYLEEEKTHIRYDFLLNPSSLNFSVGSNYQENPTAGTNVPRLQFRYGEAQTLELDGLIYVAPNRFTSLRPLLEAGVALTRANPSQGIYHSPVVSFVWGSRKFAPAVVSKFQFKETQWNAGEPILAEGTMSLIEVPPAPPAPAAATSTPENPRDSLPLRLTPALLQQGSREALQWTRENVHRLEDQRIRERVRVNRFRIRTDEGMRVIYLTDERGQDLLQLGVNQNGRFQRRAA